MNQEEENLNNEYEERMKNLGLGQNQNEFNEYSFQKNAKHYTHYPEDDTEGYNAKLTLLSRNAKKTMTSNNTQGALSFVNEADFSKIQPKMAKSELRENTILKGLKDSNQILKNQIKQLNDDKDELERRIKKLLRDLDDLESDNKNREKWRIKFNDMEENYHDLKDKFDNSKKRNLRNVKELEDELEKIKLNLKQF